MFHLGCYSPFPCSCVSPLCHPSVLVTHKAILLPGPVAILCPLNKSLHFNLSNTKSSKHYDLTSILLGWSPATTGWEVAPGQALPPWPTSFIPQGSCTHCASTSPPPLLCCWVVTGPCLFLWEALLGFPIQGCLDSLLSQLQDRSVCSSACFSAQNASSRYSLGACKVFCHS